MARDKTFHEKLEPWLWSLALLVLVIFLVILAQGGAR